MIKNFLNIKEKKQKPLSPTKELQSKTVPAQRFNEMIDYYTAELKSRLDEIKRLKEENEMLKFKNFGRKSLTELQEKLGEMGLYFGMKIDSNLIES